MTLSSKYKITIEMYVTKPQVLSLMSMFRYWNTLSGVGSSRYVAFLVDGDGDFHPNCKVVVEPEIKLTDEIYKFAPLKVSEDPQKNKVVLNLNDGDVVFDYDKIAWRINDG